MVLHLRSTAKPHTCSMEASARPGLDLYWIPLGAGSRVICFRGKAYEALDPSDLTEETCLRSPEWSNGATRVVDGYSLKLEGRAHW